MIYPETMDTNLAGRYLATEDDPISEATMRWWRATGKGPKYLKIGRRIIYTRPFLDEYKAQCVRDPREVA